MTDEALYPRQSMDVDIVCVGFGPAAGGFLSSLAKEIVAPDGSFIESKAMPGMPLQVICYERADDIGFGVSGVVSRARSIKESFPDQDFSEIPMCGPLSQEKLVYLLDPDGASRRPALLKFKDEVLRILGRAVKLEDYAVESPYIPAFMQKHGGLSFSIGQFNQWVGANLMGSGLVQIWPSMPVAAPLIEDDTVKGVRLADQGVDKAGNPEAGYMPGMDILARLSVIADGPVGPVGRAIDAKLGLPRGRQQRDYAVGLKAVVDLPGHTKLKPGLVLHSIGYPEPEIFGFMYVLPGNVASLGIFVPSWFDSPVRTGYRYLQHYMRHPYIYKMLKGGKLRSWGAKTLQESGKHGEPHLAGNGFARIGEGSGSTNVLTGSGVDEAWATGCQLAQGTVELLRANKPFSRENLEAAYVAKRRASFVEKEAAIAVNSRDGFQQGFVPGLLGMALAGLTNGKLYWPSAIKRPYERLPSLEDYFAGRVSKDEIAKIRAEATAKGTCLHEALMDKAGWPKIEPDGELFLSHQDALLLGGKVQAPGGYADHVVFVNPELCNSCQTKICVEACSGQAIRLNPAGGTPLFDREKCVHCGACLWNCSRPRKGDPERMNVEFNAGAGGLHSAEN